MKRWWVGVGLVGVAALHCNNTPSLPPPDPTDYDRDRPAELAFYSADVPAYWARYGVPALVRLSEQIGGLGGDPQTAFEGLQAAFNPNGFMSAVEQSQLPAEFNMKAVAQLAAGATPWQAWLNVTTALVDELDAVRAAQGEQAARVAQIVALEQAVFPVAFQADQVALLAPSGPKTFSTPPPLNFGGVLGAFNSTAFTETIYTSATDAGPDDHNTTRTRDWAGVGDAGITGVLWQTEYNASCSAQAVGPCAVKLGIPGFGPHMNCSDWNNLSRMLHAVAGGGAEQSDIADWFRSNGYSCSRAWNGPMESACDEARKAHNRGCDVLFDYTSPDGMNGHMEMVTHLSPDNNGQCTVDTLSWGQPGTVTYDNGQYKNKSDGARYRHHPPMPSYLEGTGDAKLRYYCKDS